MKESTTPTHNYNPETCSQIARHNWPNCVSNIKCSQLAIFRKIKWSIHTSWMKPVGIFQRPRVAGEQCFSCTTSTFTNSLQEVTQTLELANIKCRKVYKEKKKIILHRYHWWQILQFLLDAKHLPEACKVLQESSKLTSHIPVVHDGIQTLPDTKISYHRICFFKSF